MGEVRTEFTSDIKRLEKAYDEMDKRNRKLADQLQQLKEKSKDSNKTHQDGIEGTIGKLGKMAAGYLSVQGALQLINAELRTKADLEAKSLATNVSAANAEIQMMRNMAGASDRDIASAKSKVASISKQTGMSQRDLFLAGSTAMSAKGNLSTSAALEAVAMSAALAPDSGEITTQSAGALLGLSKATGSTNMKENAGYLLGIGQKARVTDLGLLSSNVVPAVIGVSSYGGDAKDTGALIAAITAASEDATGAASGNAAIKFAEQLADYLPEKNRLDEKGRLAAKATGLSSTTERIEFLRANPAIRDKFIAQMSIEAKQKARVKQILEGGLGGDYFDEFRKDIKMGDEASKVVDRTLASYRAVGSQRIAQADRMLDAGTEGVELEDTQGAEIAIARKFLTTKLPRAGFGVIANKMAEWEFDATVDSPEEGFDLLESLLTNKNQQQQNLGYGKESEATTKLLEELRAIRQVLVDSKNTRPPATESHTE